MKTAAIATLGLLWISGALAQTQVLLEVEFIETSQRNLTKLMRDFDAEQTDDELFEKVEQLLDSGEAEVYESMLLRGRSGHRFKGESIHEYIYPTEVDPPSSNQLDNAATPQRQPAEGEDAPEKPKVYPLPAQMPVPVAFETRNTGLTVEVDPVVGLHNEIDISMSIELVEHIGDTPWMEVLTPDEKLTIFRMPDFYSMRITTYVTVANGSRALIGTTTPHGSDGKPDRSRKLLIFMKASASKSPSDEQDDGSGDPTDPFGDLE